MMIEPTRKLAAIVFTDIVGFTKLTAKDQSKASALLRQQRGLFRPIVDSYNGTWVKEMGDGLLLIFDTVTDAVNCCIKLQETSKQIDDLNLRIGIHQGEILVEENDVIGDDINVAARIEPFSAPGGIAISNKVHDAIIREEEFETKYLGKPKLKGVGQKVEVYCITSHELAETDLSQVSTKLEPEGFKWNFYSLTGFILTVTGVIFWINLAFLQIGISKDYDASTIAIIPFENKGESKDEFYAYGISTDLISTVSSRAQVYVSSINDIEKIDYENIANSKLSKNLSARYILRGTLWKMNDLFQLSLELFDAQSSEILWTENWETQWDKLGKIKEEISEKVLEQINVKLNIKTKESLPIDPEAYEYYLRAKYKYEKKEFVSIEDIEVIRSLLNRAIELDNNILIAKDLLARLYLYTNEYKKARELFDENLAQAERLKDNYSRGQSLDGIAICLNEKSKYKESLQYYNRSLEMHKDSGNLTAQIRINSSMAGIYLRQRNFINAFNHFNKSLKVAQKEKNNFYQYENCKELAKAYRIQAICNFDSSKLYSKKLISLADSLNNDRNRVEAWKQMAYLYKGYPFNAFNLDSALNYCLKALELSEDRSYDDFTIQLLLDLVDIYNPHKIMDTTRQQFIEKAFPYHMQAVDLALKVQDVNQLRIGLKGIFLAGGPDKEPYTRQIITLKFEEVLSKALKSKNPELIALVLTEMPAQNSKNELENYIKALEYLEQTGKRSAIHDAFNNIANTYMDLDDWSNTNDYLYKMLLNALVMDNSGLAKEAIKKREVFRESKGYIKDAIKISIENIDYMKNNGISYKHTLSRLAGYYFESGDLEKAYSRIKEVFSLKVTSIDSLFFLHDLGVIECFRNNYENCIRIMESHNYIIDGNPQYEGYFANRWKLANMTYILFSKKMLNIKLDEEEIITLNFISQNEPGYPSNNIGFGFSEITTKQLNGIRGGNYDNHLPSYITFLLTNEKKFINTAYNNLMMTVEMMDESQKSKYLGYPIQKEIITSFNK